jgi:hypothetical protein
MRSTDPNMARCTCTEATHNLASSTNRRRLMYHEQTHHDRTLEGFVAFARGLVLQLESATSTIYQINIRLESAWITAYEPYLMGSWKSSCTVAHWCIRSRASNTLMSILGP